MQLLNKMRRLQRTVEKHRPQPQPPDPTEAATLRESLVVFTRAAWPIVEPASPLRWNWHLDAIAEHLEAVTAGDLRFLLINIPPRMTKSLMVSVLWPAWEWASTPETKWLYASHRQALSIRDSVATRRLIEHPWYQQLFPNVELRPDQNQKMRYDTTAGGSRIAMTLESVTGEGGNRRVIDDPHSADDSYRDTIRESQIEAWRSAWSTRTIDPNRDTEVVIMQRLHERDLSGYILEEVGGYEHLMLPMRFEPERRCITSLGFRDPRETDGELLDPERFDENAVSMTESRLGSYGAAGQFQQRPAPAEGGIIKRAWIRYWQPPGVTLPPVPIKTPEGTIHVSPITIPPDRDRTNHLQSWDMAFKGSDSSSRVCGQAWLQVAADCYLMDMEWAQMDFPETLHAVERFTARNPQHQRRIVEDKANGPAVIAVLQTKLGGMIPANPHGSKEARLHAQSWRFEGGNVYLPHPSLFPWVDNLITALTTFPATIHSDPVDATSQALDHMPAQAGGDRGYAPTRRSDRYGGQRR